MYRSGNPYQYGSPVSGPHFAGRKEELSTLTKRLNDSINISLISPRRYGKTSLLEAAAGRIQARPRSGAVVSVSVLKTPSLADFSSALVTSAYRVPGGWRRSRDGISDFLRRFRITPSISLGLDNRPTFSFSPHLSNLDYLRSIEEVYSLLNRIANDRPAVLILDEFQEITSIGVNMANFFKSMSDTYPLVSLAIAGSNRHMMKNLLLTHSSPLYGMTETMFLEPLPETTMIEYLRARAESSEKPISEAAARLILSLSNPVPNDIQRLAYESWALGDHTIGTDTVLSGMENAISHQSNNYASVFSRLTNNQRKVLLALAQGAERNPFSSAFVSRAAVANASSVKKALTALESADLIVERAGEWSVDDPFFKQWILRS